MYHVSSDKQCYETVDPVPCEIKISRNPGEMVAGRGGHSGPDPGSRGLSQPFETRSGPVGGSIARYLAVM